MTSITVQAELARAHSDARDRARHRARGGVGGAVRGHGKDKASDQAAVDAMRRELNKLPIDGTVVIGEGEIDEAPMLFIGEKVGTKQGPKVDIAVDPLEGTILCAKNMPGAIATIAMAEAARCCTRPTATWKRSPSAPAIRRAPSISTRRPRKTSCARQGQGRQAVARSPRSCSIGRATPRSSPAVRKTGAAVALIRDGDVAGVIHCAEPKTGIDIYLGIGGAPEGVLAAAALRCIGGQMQGRLVIDTEELRERTLKMGIKDAKKKYEIEDMVRGDCLFAATGVTTGAMLQRRQVRQGHDRDRHGGDALGHRHRAPRRRRASRILEIPPRLTARPARKDVS